MNDIYNNNTATDPMQVMSANNMIPEKNWLQRNSDWLIPMGANAAQMGYNIYANEKNNKFNAEEAEKQRNWEEYMSNTAYQRAYEDMRLAGLNPHLAGGQGGASTPTGSAATTTGMMPMDFASTINTALTSAQMENVKADTELKGKQAGKTNEEIKGLEIENEYKARLKEIEIALNETQNKKQKAEIQKIFSEIHVQEKQLRKMDEEIEILKSEGKIKEAEAKTRVRNRRAYAILEMAESGTRTVKNIIDSATKVQETAVKAMQAF